MKYLIPAITFSLFAFTACQSEHTTETTNTNTDTGAYVNPTTGSEGMTIPDRDTPYIETESPELLKKTDSSMQNSSPQQQGY